MNYKLAVIPGDGIGPDVVEQTLLVLDKKTKGAAARQNKFAKNEKND